MANCNNKYIIPMTLEIENADIVMTIDGDLEDIPMTIELPQEIPMLVHLIYGDFEPQSAIAGIAVAGIAIAGYVWS